MKLITIFLILLSSAFLSCTVEPGTFRISDKDKLLVPIGKTTPLSFSTRVYLNGTNYEYKKYCD